MEPEGLLPYSQEHASGFCPEPDESNPHSPNPISLRFVLILGLPSSHLPSGFFDQNFVRISHFPHARYTPRPYHTS
jgi:hypothetical protein